MTEKQLFFDQVSLLLPVIMPWATALFSIIQRLAVGLWNMYMSIARLHALHYPAAPIGWKV